MNRMPHSHPFLSVQRRDRSLPAQPYDTRDELPNSLICKALHRHRGFEFGKELFNYPPEELTREHLPEEELFHIDLSHIYPEDVIVMTTRPAMHDYDEDFTIKKWLEPGNTSLERAILQTWNDYVDWLSRAQVTLTQNVAEHLEKGFENRSCINFRQKCSSFYYKLSRLRGPLRRVLDCENTTAGFLLHLAELWPGGPELIHTFGMNAISTLVLCNQLAEKHNHLLEKTGFFMLELEAQAPIPVRPATLDWTLDWEVKPILKYPLH